MSGGNLRSLLYGDVSVMTYFTEPLFTRYIVMLTCFNFKTMRNKYQSSAASHLGLYRANSVCLCPKHKTLGHYGLMDIDGKT